MFNKLKNAIAALALAVLPMGATAATFIQDGNAYGIHFGSEFFGDVTSTSGGAGSWTIEFNATASPIDTEASLSIGRIVANQFTDLRFSWLDSSLNVLNSVLVPSAPGANLATRFTASNLDQFLRIDWTNSTAGAGFDVEVAADVPVPAAGLLLVTALGGFAIMRRRRKDTRPAGLVAA